MSSLIYKICRILLALFIFGFVSCADIAGAIFEDEDPSFLTASDGFFSDQIRINWAAPDLDLDDDDINERSVSNYSIERRVISTLTWTEIDTSSTSVYYDTSVRMGIKYEYRVKAHFTDWLQNESGYSDPDSGFAIEYCNLKLYQNEAKAAANQQSFSLEKASCDNFSSNCFYFLRFLAQENWTYHINIPTAISAEFVSKDLSIINMNLADPQNVLFTAAESKEYYLKVYTDSPSLKVTAWYE